MKGKQLILIMFALPLLSGMGFSHQPSPDVGTWDRFAFNVAGHAIEVKMPPNAKYQHTRETVEKPDHESIYIIQSSYDEERTIFSAPIPIFDLHLELILNENEANYPEHREFPTKTAALVRTDSLFLLGRNWACAEYEFSSKGKKPKTVKLSWWCFTKVGSDQGLYVRGVLGFFDHRLSRKFIDRRREIFDKVVETVQITEQSADR